MAAKLRPLKEIRYLETTEVPGPGEPPFASADGVFALPCDIHRTGERIGCLLESEGLSFGTFDHLFIALTTAIPPGQVVPVGIGFEPWMGFAAFGLPRSFQALAAQDKLCELQAATFKVLRSLQPSQKDLIVALEKRLLAGGTRTRVLRALKDTKSLSIEVWFDVPPIGEKPYLYVIANEKTTGQTLVAPPFPLAEYDHAFPLVSAVTYSKGAVNLIPRKSFRANLSTRGYDVPIQFPLSTFMTVAVDDV